MFTLTQAPIDIESLRRRLDDRRAGAFVGFEGVVRSTNEGNEVISLLYEAYEPLAVAEGNSILKEARQRFDIHGCLCCHRTGLLQVGELAVYAAVSAEHRDAAFQACRYVIDEVKLRVPIWKQETLRSGERCWVNCDHAHKTEEKLELDVLALSGSELAKFKIVDIREPHETKLQLLRSLLRQDVIAAPLSQISADKFACDLDTPYLFICQHGERSRSLVESLRARGFSNVWSAAGGVEAIRRKYIA